MPMELMPEFVCRGSIRPKIVTAMATSMPTSGPEMPTSNSARLVGTGPFCRMMAPMVPMGGSGKGMK